MIDKISQVMRAKRLINDLVNSTFFGEVIFKLEHGNIVCVEIGENRRVDSVEAQQLVEDPTTEEVRIKKRTGDVSLARVTKKGSLEQIVPPVPVKG